MSKVKSRHRLSVLTLQEQARPGWALRPGETGRPRLAAFITGAMFSADRTLDGAAVAPN